MYNVHDVDQASDFVEERDHKLARHRAANGTLGTSIIDLQFQLVQAVWPSLFTLDSYPLDSIQWVHQVVTLHSVGYCAVPCKVYKLAETLPLRLFHKQCLLNTPHLEQRESRLIFESQRS